MTRNGELAKTTDLIDVTTIREAYYREQPDATKDTEMVVFGTSGHRGAATKRNFNAAHIAAITQAIVEYRRSQQITGPIMVGLDTHYLSVLAFRTCLEVLAANGVEYFIDTHITAEKIEQATAGQYLIGSGIWTPTPAISRAIIHYNSDKKTDLADGIVITPSHNPPEGGGFKYNATNGGPASDEATKAIAKRANELLLENFEPTGGDFAAALQGAKRLDFRKEYIEALPDVIDLAAIKAAGVKILANPLGGSSIDYWSEIAKTYDLDLEVVPDLDPTFRFMTLDWDEKIRLDCSSKDAMAGTLKLAQTKDQFDLVLGNDTDADRHGIIARDLAGEWTLMNPNHYLAVAVDYLFDKGRRWSPDVKVGKTLVSSTLIDLVTKGLDRELYEVPVGFKWFVPGLESGALGFGGEESAGASFLKMNGEIWTTDKDGILLGLLAAEIIAKTGKSPAVLHQALTEKYGQSWYARIDAPATFAEKAKLKALSPDQVTATELAGEKILKKLTTAPGNDAPIGGLKVVTEHAWFVARPSGTEDIYKIYAESFLSEPHLRAVQSAAQSLVQSTK